MKTSTKIAIAIVVLLCLVICGAAIGVSASGDYYVVNATSGKFHLPTCSYLPDPSNRYTIPREDITNPEYAKLSPCAHCDPLNKFVYEPENPGQSSDGSFSGSLGTFDPYYDTDENEHSEYYEFKEAFREFTTTYGIGIPIAILFIFTIYTAVTHVYTYIKAVRIIGYVMAALGGGLFFLNLVLLTLSPVAFFIIELFL